MGPGGRSAASGPLNDATTSPCGPFPLGIAYGDTRDKLISAVHPAWTHRGALEYLDRLLAPADEVDDLHHGPIGDGGGVVVLLGDQRVIDVDDQHVEPVVPRAQDVADS